VEPKEGGGSTSLVVLMNFNGLMILKYDSNNTFTNKQTKKEKKKYI
jgi:hypothetical protein